MFKLGCIIENIKINFNKLYEIFNEEVCKILTKLFKKNNLLYKEKMMKVKCIIIV